MIFQVEAKLDGEWKLAGRGEFSSAQAAIDGAFEQFNETPPENLRVKKSALWTPIDAPGIYLL